MSLLDEVKAASSRKGSRCALCEWLASLPDDEAGEWQEVFEA